MSGGLGTSACHAEAFGHGWSAALRVVSSERSAAERGPGGRARAARARAAIASPAIEVCASADGAVIRAHWPEGAAAPEVRVALDRCPRDGAVGTGVRLAEVLPQLERALRALPARARPEAIIASLRAEVVRLAWQPLGSSAEIRRPTTPRTPSS